MNNLNSKGEVSQACRKIPKLKAYVAHAIDKIEDLRKYCVYLDKTPLEETGLDYYNEEVEHKTLPKTLISNGNINQENVVIYRQMFDERELDKLKCYIFIGMPTTKINNSINTYYMLIEVLVPQEYNILLDEYSERIYEISNLICQRLDNHIIRNNERNFEEIGNLEFKADNVIHEARLSNMNTHLSVQIPFIIRGSGNTYYED